MITLTVWCIILPRFTSLDGAEFYIPQIVNIIELDSRAALKTVEALVNRLDTAQDMIRIRKLQRKGEDGAWHSDAYAVEMPGGQVTLRYSLAWEYLGGRYNRLIQERGLSLEQLEQVLAGDSLRWLPVETFVMDDEQVIRTLDRECHVPRWATVLAGQRDERRVQTEAITLEAHIVGGRLQLEAPLTSPIRAQGDHIYLEDGRRLQITLASEPGRRSPHKVN